MTPPGIEVLDGRKLGPSDVLGRTHPPLMVQLYHFFLDLKGSDSQTFHNKAITYREMNMEKSPLSKLVLGLCSQTHPTEPQDSITITPNHIS